MVSMLSQTSLSQISMHIEIFIPWKHLSFESEFNNQFNNHCSKSFKRTNQRYSVFSHWEIQVFWDFYQNLWKILVKEFIFGNDAGYMGGVRLKRTFLRYFSKILPTDSVDKNYKIAFQTDFIKTFSPTNS